MANFADSTTRPFAVQYVRHVLSAAFHATVIAAVLAALTVLVSSAYIAHHLFVDGSTPVMLPFASCTLVGGYLGIIVFRAEVSGDAIPKRHRRLIVWLSVVYWNLVLGLSLILALIFGNLIAHSLVFPFFGLGYAMLEAILAPRRLSIAAWLSVIVVGVVAVLAHIIKGDGDKYENRRRDAVGLIRHHPGHVIRGVPHPQHAML